MSGKRILGAVRLSRDTDESTSTERQREQITLMTQVRGDTLIHITEDVDVSGKVSPFDRPELGPWLTEPDKIAQWDAIMVAKLDRLSRSMMDFLTLLDWCKRNGKTIISVGESLDFSTAHGRMFAQLLAMFADFERERIGERRAEAAVKLRSEARWGGGRRPYGYQVFKNGHMILVPKPDEQAVVIRAADESIMGRSANAIVRDFNSEGIPSQSGKPWRSSTLIRILRNPVIRGYVMNDPKPREVVNRKGQKRKVYGNPQPVRDEDGMPVRRKALIDDDTWDRLQAALDKNAKPRSGAASDANLLLRVAYCANCGEPLYGHARKGRGYGYYQCATRRMGGKCPSKSVRIDVLDRTATDALMLQVGSAPMLKRIVHLAEDHTRKLAEIDRQIADIETEVVNGLPAASARRMLATLHTKAEALRALPQRPERIEWADTGQTFAEHWDGLDNAEKHRLMIESGFEVRVGNDPDGRFTFGFQLDPELVRRVRAVGMGDPVNRPAHAEIQASWEAPDIKRKINLPDTDASVLIARTGGAS